MARRPAKKQVWFDTTLPTFAAQLAAIKRGHFNVVSLDALDKHLTQEAPIFSFCLEPMTEEQKRMILQGTATVTVGAILLYIAFLALSAA